LVRSEEEYIANKLMKKLTDLQKEKEALAKKVQMEEENLTNNLKRRLKDLH
jgi:hypothetical protein